MDNISDLTCTSCGRRVGRQLHTGSGNRCYCEDCFLDGRKAASWPDDVYSAFAEALVEALDLREHETGLHSKRVACHTLVLARRFISDPMRLRQFYWGALLHDIGKIGIADAILLKEGPLDENEWAEMRTHPEKGHAIVVRLPFMQEAAEIILNHEERYDGSGYPGGLAGDTIPLGARLFAVIDTLDAITSNRPYRKGSAYDTAKREILKRSGTQFDPSAVEAFITEEAVLREMVALKCELPAGSIFPSLEN